MIPYWRWTSGRSRGGRNGRRRPNSTRDCKRAGEELREKALNRVSPNDGKGYSPSDGRGLRHKRRFSVDQREEENRHLLAAHLKTKADMEHKRLKLDVERLECERWKGAEEAQHIPRSQEHDTKVLAPNEKRIQLEVEHAALHREEQKSAPDERKKIISVLGALAEKLK